jgi:putative DNA primase/helicase
MAAGDLLAAALDYAAKGWPVFPCHPVTKAPLVAGDKDADGKPIPKTGGVKKASTDARQIRDWWTRWPNALIGCATGVAFNVIDFDPRTDDATGEVFTLDRLKAEVEAQIGVALPKTLHSITQSGGVHLFFALPDDGGAPINNRGNLPLHVDVRGLGGYVIVPPSVMESGRLYKWRGSPTTPIAPMPAELVAVLRAPGKGAASEGDSPSPRRAARVSPSPARGEGSAGIDAADEAVRKYGLAAADAEIRNLAGTGDGGRNNALNAAAFALGSLVGAGALSESLARSMLRDVAAQWPNLAKSEGTIESGLTSGMDSPRDLSEVRAKARNRPEEPPPHLHEGADRRESSQMGGSAPPPPAGKAARNHDREGSFLPLTDLGNAERWEGRHGGSFRYCDELGWLAWDGKRWSKDDAERLLQESVFATVRGIGDEADWLAQAGEDWRAAAADAEKDGREIEA